MVGVQAPGGKRPLIEEQAQGLMDSGLSPTEHRPASAPAADYVHQVEGIGIVAPELEPPLCKLY